MPADVPPPLAAQEDQARFAEMYAKYAKHVLVYFIRRLGDGRDAAEDLMQETFMKAFSRFDTFQDRGFSYLTYLLRIAHNVLANHWRPKQALPLEAAENLADESETSGIIQQRIDSKTLWIALQDLSAAEREVLFLKYQDDLPVKAIAERTGRSENSVKLLMSRARKKLAKHPSVTELAASL